MQRAKPTGCARLDGILEVSANFLEFMKEQDENTLDTVLDRIETGRFVFDGDSEESIIKRVLEYQRFVNSQLRFADSQLALDMQRIFNNIGIESYEIKDSIALYDTLDRKQPLAKLVVDSKEDLDDIEFNRKNLLYERRERSTFFLDGKPYRIGPESLLERLMVFRVGSAYYLPTGEVILSRTKKMKWAEKVVRVLYGKELGKEKGFRDIAAFMLLDHGDRITERRIASLDWLGLQLRKEYRAKPREDGYSTNHYYSDKREVPIEFQALSFGEFEKREYGDLSHVRFKGEVEGNIKRKLKTNSELDFVWRLMHRVCDVQFIAPSDVQVPETYSKPSLIDEESIVITTYF